MPARLHGSDLPVMSQYEWKNLLKKWDWRYMSRMLYKGNIDYPFSTCFCFLPIFPFPVSKVYFFISYSKSEKITRSNLQALFNSNSNDIPNQPLIKECLSSAYLKIFLNYLQMLSISKMLNLNWERSLVTFFQISETVSGSFIKVMNLECLFGGLFFIFLKSFYFL